MSVPTQIWTETKSLSLLGFSLVLPLLDTLTTQPHTIWRWNISSSTREAGNVGRVSRFSPSCRWSARYTWHKPSPCAFVTTQNSTWVPQGTCLVCSSPLLPRDELGHLKESTEAAFGPQLCSWSQLSSQKASFTRTDTRGRRFMINPTAVCSCSCNKNGPFVGPDGLKQGDSIFRQFFWLLGKKFKFSPKLKDDSGFVFGLSENFLWKQHVWESTHVQEKGITGDEEVKKEHIQEFLMHLHFCS